MGRVRVWGWPEADPDFTLLRGRSPAHTVSGWAGGQEATVGEQPDVPGCPRKAVAVLGLGVHSGQSAGPRGNAGPFQECSAQAWAGQQGGVTGGEGPWSWGHCLALSRHTALT